METNDLDTEKIERNILLQILGVSLISILIYIINALFFNHSSDVFYQSLVAFVFYSFFFLLVYIPGGNFELKKNIVSLVMFLSVIASFFSLGGLKGAGIIDFVNIVLYTSILYKDRLRNSLIFFLLFTLIALASIQINFPEVVKNNLVNEPSWMLSLHIITRIFLSFNIASALKDAYSKEHEIAAQLIKKVNALNNEVLAQNEELKSIQEDLKINNAKLEEIVLERTRKLEVQNETLITYAYMNSHIFRGPICRLLGLLNLMKIEKDPVEKNLLENYISNEVESIDKVVKDISKVLYENDQDLMDEIRTKARSLYQV